MKLSDYFENKSGIGVLATADGSGKVNAAIYARPYFLDPNDESAISLIMSDRKSHDNLCENPNALYMFIEEGEEYEGKRLSLTNVGEETDQEKIRLISRRKFSPEKDEDRTRFLVHFRIDDIRPLIGASE
jgi:hypothetical protein